jgi:hypothetical protein
MAQQPHKSVSKTRSIVIFNLEFSIITEISKYF